MDKDKNSGSERPVALVVAMQKELDLMLPLLDGLKTVNSEFSTFYEGTFQGKPVVAVKCGIGKVNAALAANELIDRYHPKLVINSGVAGGTGHGASILDIVVATEIAYHDVWCGPGTAEGEAAGCPARFRSDPRVVALPSLRENSRVKHGLVASGDIFVSKAEDVERITSLYPEAKAVDMESAAIAQTCYKKDVPFFCVRVVSDTPGAADNIGQYENFWDDAPRSTFEMLMTIIKEIDF